MRDRQNSRSVIMDRRRTLLSLAALAGAGALPSAGRAQPAAKPPHVAIVHSGPPANFRRRAEAFTRALRELGYEDGRNVQLDFRAANGQPDLLREITRKLAREEPQVVVTGSTSSTRAMFAETNTLPIVMASVEDPVSEGFAKSLAHPGYNVTGMSGSVLDQLGRQMELLAQVAPRLRRVTALLNPTNSAYKTYRARVEFGLPPGMRLTVVNAGTAGEIEHAFPGRSRDEADGALVMNDALFYGQRRAIAELAAGTRRPTIYPHRAYVEVGGLISWGPNPEANIARAASYVDRILKGTRPAELAIEPPARLELYVNKEAARLLGAALPPELLQHATVIGT